MLRTISALAATAVLVFLAPDFTVNADRNLPVWLGALVLYLLADACLMAGAYAMFMLGKINSSHAYGFATKIPPEVEKLLMLSGVAHLLLLPVTLTCAAYIAVWLPLVSGFLTGYLGGKICRATRHALISTSNDPTPAELTSAYSIVAAYAWRFAVALFVLSALTATAVS